MHFSVYTVGRAGDLLPVRLSVSQHPRPIVSFSSLNEIKTGRGAAFRRVGRTSPADWCSGYVGFFFITSQIPEIYSFDLAGSVSVQWYQLKTGAPGCLCAAH